MRTPRWLGQNEVLKRLLGQKAYFWGDNGLSRQSPGAAKPGSSIKAFA
jgi:hypothetical protein